MRKVLWIILGFIIIILLGVSIWWLSKRISNNKEQAAMRNINVAPLANDDEKKIGTIIYAGAKKIGEVTTVDNASTLNLTTTDSLDGAFNIYYQDVLNRYKTYSVSKKEISKSNAVNGKAKVITVSGQTGQINITIWTRTDGLCQIQIVTSNDFK